MEKIITEEMLAALRSAVGDRMSPKRYNHTLEVEKMAVRLGELYLPHKINVLRAAALLHDITKEYRNDEQLVLLAKYSVSVSPEELLAPKTFHARSAAALIPDEYTDFADQEIVSAVRWHTTGRAGMTLPEKLIYLADYVDMSRSFEDCVRLRDYFFSAVPERMGYRERLLHLDRTLVLSFDMTIQGLISTGSVISDDTMRARNDLIRAIRSREAGER